MTFISYAQNFEDVMLWRALKHVENGFYIEVGANDPSVDSVTCAFYGRGWRGINVESAPQCYERFRVERAFDINLLAAVGAREDVLHCYDVMDRGPSASDPQLAQKYIGEGRKVVERRLPQTTLNAVCREYAREPIHFIKVDLPGSEAQVLHGFDLKKWRPWILVVESARSQSQVGRHVEWEDLVLQAGYQFVYCDGLNRFYLAGERQALRAAFDLPPNRCDEFRLRPNHPLSHPITDVLARLQDAQNQIASAQARLVQLEQQVRADVLNRQLQAISASTSWKITASLRAASAFAKRCGSLVAHPRRFAGGLMRRMAPYAVVRQIGARLLAPFPSMRERVRRFASTSTPSDMSPGQVSHPITVAEVSLSLPARAILDELRAAMRKAR